MNDAGVVDIEGSLEKNQTDNALIEMGQQMIDGVLVKIDSSFGSLSAPVKEELARQYAEDWMTQAGNKKERAMELARQSATPIKVPTGIRTQWNNWTVHSGDFIECLNDLHARFFSQDGKFDREAFSNAIALNIMNLPDPDDSQHNLYYEARNLCDLLAMVERLGWVTDGYQAVNGGSYLTYNATRYTYPFYPSISEQMFLNLGGNNQDYGILAKLTEKHKEIAEYLFVDRGTKYVRPLLEAAREGISGTFQEFNDKVRSVFPTPSPKQNS